MISHLTIILEFLFHFILTHSFLQLPLHPKKQDVIACITTFAINEALPLNVPIFIHSIMVQIPYLLYIMICYSKNISDGILLYALSFSMILIVQNSIVALAFLLRLNPTAGYMDILGNLLTIIVLYLLLHIPSIASVYDRIIHAAIPYRLILLDTWLILFFILLLFKLLPVRLLTSIAFITSMTLLLITVNIAILYYDQRMQKQNQILESYQKNLPIYESLISEIRASQHEYSNHLQNLQNLTMTCPDYNSLCHALNHYTKEYASPMHTYPLLQINMPLLAASLYSLTSRAEHSGISVQFDVANHRLESHIPEHELTDYACILLQNAIEACQCGDYIYVNLSSNHGMVHLETRNPVTQLYKQQDIRKFFQKHYSTKTKQPKENGIPHGLGLYILRNGIIKQHGKLGADCIRYEDRFWMIFWINI